MRSVDPRVGLGWVGNGSKICAFNGLGWVMGLKWQMCEKMKKIHVVYICNFVLSVDRQIRFGPDFPVLSEVARRVMCTSASSAQSERDFSCVVHTITDTRSRLSAEKVESVELIRWGLRA